jgi:Holliday junction resolvasome RuvABC ATP-dependent DNA helicase subunit
MTDNNSTGQFDSFLTDAPEENVDYIKPNIELKLSKEKRQECRDIVLEVRKFGVNQRQLLYLIYLLSLELEDNVTMKALAKAIGENRDNIKAESFAEEQKTQLILDV